MKQTNISKLRSQAARALKSQQAWGHSRADTKRADGTSAGIHSVRTWNENVTALAKIADEMGVRRLKEIDIKNSIEYLILRVKADLSDKTLSRDRVALERFLGRKLPCYQDLQKMGKDPKQIDKWMKLAFKFMAAKSGNPNTPLGKRSNKNEVPSKAGVGSKRNSPSRPGDSPRRLKDISRAYTDNQIREIANSFEKERERLAILLMRDSGLRVHEMFTLRRVGEGKPVTNQRDWIKERHLLRENGVKYLVTGKGGLTREVVISKPLAERLEKLRFQKPQKVRDRKVIYRQRYNLLGGNALSSRFTLASKNELGFSLGAHGFRHSYAQARMTVLLSNGVKVRLAKQIVSQEMGHMRVSITNTYLR